MNQNISRRSALGKIAGSTAALAASASLTHRLRAADAATAPGLKGRVNHSVCKWCYDKIPLEDFCKAAKEIGLQSVELLEAKDFPTLKKYDLACAMVSGGGGADAVDAGTAARGRPCVIAALRSWAAATASCAAALSGSSCSARFHCSMASSSWPSFA